MSATSSRCFVACFTCIGQSEKRPRKIQNFIFLAKSSIACGVFEMQMGMIFFALTVYGVSATSDLSSSYSTIVDMHISRIMPVYTSYELNHEWADRLIEQRLVHTHDLGTLVYQQHALPWPLSSRDLVLSCDISSNSRDAVFESVCHSVDHPAVPLIPGVVRIEMERSAWRFEALPNDRTRVSLDMTVSSAATNGVPRSIVRHVQRTSLRDSVTALSSAVDRLGLPPAREFIRWRRSRAEAAAAQLEADQLLTHQRPSLRWVLGYSRDSWSSSDSFLGLSSSSLLALVLLVSAHNILAFALLASSWTSKPATHAKQQRPPSRPSKGLWRALLLHSIFLR